MPKSVETKPKFKKGQTVYWEAVDIDNTIYLAKGKIKAVYDYSYYDSGVNYLVKTDLLNEEFSESSLSDDELMVCEEVAASLRVVIEKSQKELARITRRIKKLKKEENKNAKEEKQ